MYRYKRISIIYLFIWIMSKKHAKICADEYYYDNYERGGDYTIKCSNDCVSDADADADAPTAPYSILPSDEDRETIINDALDELADIARENILEFKREDFNYEEVIGTWIDSYLCQYFAEIEPYHFKYTSTFEQEADALNNVLDVYIQDLYHEIAERFHEEIAPPRVSSAIDTTENSNIHALSTKIQTLREKPQPEQRTPEWYARRNNLITASSASKAFGSQSSINQLIYDKCKNYNSGCSITSDENNVHGTGANNTSITIATPMQGPVNSPLHWGQRYEPVTVMVYEYRNHTKLGEFGCIQHEQYPFIGASPDGINIDPSSSVFGRMVEIKNIFNREITGHPKEEYWVQTQIQMEVCDLDECDFVETRFKEYESEEEYIADTSTPTDEKGIILWFQSAPALTQQGHVSPPIQLYEYAPIGMTADEYEIWEAAVFSKHEQLRSIWVRTIYWRLDEYSCVLIKRNRLWFEEAVRVIECVWKTIETERQTGYEHRAPAKRKTPQSKDTSSIASCGSGGGGGADDGTIYKIVKLDTAIIPSDQQEQCSVAITDATNIAPLTATNMASFMAINNSIITKKHNNNNNNTKRPSDVLIHCFKIDDLEINESKIEQ